MFEFHALRAILGIMQLGIVWILLKNDIGYLWRFGITMFACAASNLAPALPHNENWQHYIQFPAYVLIFGLTADATFEFFAFLRRRTFIEERSALVALSVVGGLIPVWIFWLMPSSDWYQTAMLARQYGMMWLTGGYLIALLWLRKIRPIHMELQIADHSIFWGYWLLAVTAHASTTKMGVLWRFAQWQDAGELWRVIGDVLLLAQIVICSGFVFNLWRWRDGHADSVRAASRDLPSLALFPPVHPPIP